MWGRKAAYRAISADEGVDTNSRKPLDGPVYARTDLVMLGNKGRRTAMLAILISGPAGWHSLAMHQFPALG